MIRKPVSMLLPFETADLLALERDDALDGAVCHAVGGVRGDAGQ